MTTFKRHAVRAARKRHGCAECDADIRKGERHDYYVEKVDGRIVERRAHLQHRRERES